MKDLKSKSTNFHMTQSKEADREEITASLSKEFSPEFRNRIDEFVFFNDLTREDARKIAELNLKNYPIKRTPELVDYVVKNGFSEEFGAREIRRFIKKNLGLPLSDAVLAGKKPQDGTAQYEPKVVANKIEIINTSIL
jgi:ATP-dependent Clp protease ATP-binding subunit ClpA